MLVDPRENEVEPWEERAVDDDDERVSHAQPEVLMARFPASIIVLSLEEQLERGSEGYSANDYLTPILDRFHVIEERVVEGDSPVREQVRTLRHKTYRKITDKIGAEMEMDFDDLHLDIGSADDWERVEEIYRFFCLYRQRNIENIIHETISINREIFANQFRHDTVKRNQSLREMRRVLKSYNDVLVYINYDRIVDSIFSQKDDLDLALEGCLDLIRDDSPVSDEGYLRRIAITYTDPDFLEHYLAPLENDLLRTKVVINGKQRWIRECEKKERVG